MLFGWAIIFLMISFLAGLSGFTGMVGHMSWVAQILFFVCLIAFVLSLFVGGRRPMT
jgi:uncharacterized membrane protein YtjA (UPF0391 family)